MRYEKNLTQQRGVKFLNLNITFNPKGQFTGSSCGPGRKAEPAVETSLSSVCTDDAEQLFRRAMAREETLCCLQRLRGADVMTSFTDAILFRPVIRQDG